MKIFQFVWFALVVVAVGAASLIQLRFNLDLAAARKTFVAEEHAKVERLAGQINAGFETIGQNLRTLASLPSVRSVDRHAAHLSAEARTTFQLLYNGLAEAVSVSEVYVMPIDFAPNRIDPVTGKTEEPIIAFDQLIVNPGSNMSRVERQSHALDANSPGYRGPAEIETYEYRQLTEHAAWFRANYPDNSRISGFDVPMISGGEVITCDNTTYVKTGRDHDRSGVLFSVPFFDLDGKLKGMVTAIILSNAINALLPNQGLAIVNPGNNYATMGTALSERTEFASDILAGRPASELTYSEALNLNIKDSRSPWILWAGTNNQDFIASAAVTNAHQTRNQSLVAIAILAAILGLCVRLAQRNVWKANELALSLETQRDMATKLEAEAKESAARFQSLNADVSKLNQELAERLKQLSAAQDEIVKSGRMSQLGQLVATVAHEIRNPLASVRTTSFGMRKKLTALGVDMLPQLDRIETGISRCDRIISQLLDFSRTQPLLREKVDLVNWVQYGVEEQLPTLPENINIQIDAPAGAFPAAFDPERLRRCIINLIANAADAMTAKGIAIAQPVISIALSRSSRGTEIAVKDNGPGIPPEILAKIGEPLFTTKNFGTGLGIAASRKVAELHGGGLEVASVVGQGACFTVWFPDDVPSAKSA